MPCSRTPTGREQWWAPVPQEKNMTNSTKQALATARYLAREALARLALIGAVPCLMSGCAARVSLTTCEDPVTGINGDYADPAQDAARGCDREPAKDGTPDLYCCYPAQLSEAYAVEHACHYVAQPAGGWDCVPDQVPGEPSNAPPEFVKTACGFPGAVLYTNGCK